jgi:hypothetical protein
MLIHPTLNKLRDLRLFAMAEALEDNSISPTSRTSGSKNAWGYWWTARGVCVTTAVCTPA